MAGSFIVSAIRCGVVLQDRDAGAAGTPGSSRPPSPFDQTSNGVSSRLAHSPMEPSYMQTLA